MSCHDIAKVQKAFNASHFFTWVGALAMPQVLLVTALLAGVISIASITASRKTARQKNAIDLMMDFTKEDAFKPAFDRLREIHQNPQKSVESFAKTDENSEAANEIRLLLNYLENVAIGVRNHIYDEKIIRDNRRTLILHTWDMTLPYIHMHRERYDNPRYYEHLEWLVNRFNKRHRSWRCLWLLCHFMPDRRSRVK